MLDSRVRRAALGLWLAALALAALGCGDDETNPSTFHERCGQDAAVCKDPFECVPVHPGGSEEGDAIPICTMPCKRDSECPYLGEPKGHCGVYQAVCIEGFCQGWCV